jgi:hypothetical protein
MPPTTLARRTLYTGKLEEFTKRFYEGLLHQAGLYVVERHTITTAVYELTQDAPRSDEADQAPEAGESFTPGDGHHELARARETAGLNYDEGEE